MTCVGVSYLVLALGALFGFFVAALFRAGGRS
jgi:hypothetical protein